MYFDDRVTAQSMYTPVTAYLTNIPVVLNGINVNTQQQPALNYQPTGSPYPLVYIPAVTLTALGAAVAWDGSRVIVTTSSPTVQAAMQRDIDMLKTQSPDQQQSETNYKGLTPKPTITVASVTPTELRFADKPQVFQGNYTGQFDAGRTYPSYEEADIGGKRFYIVKDNFGVWITFKYTVPF